MNPEATVFLSGHLPWWRQWQTPHYVAMLLSQRVRVIYVEPAVAWSRTTASYSVGRNPRGLLAPLWKVQENLWVYTPWAWPFGRVPTVARWNGRSFGRRLLTFTAPIVKGEIVLWMSDLFTSPLLIRLFPEAPKVFHALDYVVGEREMRAAESLAARVDLVLAATPIIAKSFAAEGSRVEVFRNGWSFGNILPGPRDILEEMVRIPTPRVGMIGYLSSNLDYSLMYRVVNALPISLVLVGRRIGHLSQEDQRFLRLLRANPRVFFLGERPTEVLRSYIEYLDVCIAPYKDNARIYGSDPLKIYQYMACGKPTVATRVQILESLDPLVRVGAGPEEFVELVRYELEAGADAQTIRKRRDFADGARWESRWREVEEIVLRHQRVWLLASGRAPGGSQGGVAW